MIINSVKGLCYNRNLIIVYLFYLCYMMYILRIGFDWVFYIGILVWGWGCIVIDLELK